MTVVYTSTADLEQALRRAAAAHGEHEKELGHYDEAWPVWYAEHMAREQTPPPSDQRS
ncbi:hypothetical protein AB5J62_18970 [Amycolatopsis sp. cg5]|uniref:hypothetical protein n=1 Tax=Amycolatopsis sp. cg5 TaxID=3238802 RepID=UPI003525431E